MNCGFFCGPLRFCFLLFWGFGWFAGNLFLPLAILLRGFLEILFYFYKAS